MSGNINENQEHYDPVLYAMYFNLMRIYDVLLMLYFEQAGEDKALHLRKLHEEGKMWAPPVFRAPESSE